jgi:HAD superfamily hydrolase (TIGR01509 family)
MIRDVVQAVVFDLDGVVLDSEHLWDEARREVVADTGGRWRPGATADMQGMSSPEWSGYLRGALGVDLPEHRIVALVLERLLARYRHGLPLVPGAVAVVERLARRWPLALASSANREVIDVVLEVSGLASAFSSTVSSEEVARGKPAPDVYLEAARRLGVAPGRCAAVEDAANGIRSALSAGMWVVAVPNHRYPPPADVLARAALVVERLDALTVEALEQLGGTRDAVEARLDEVEDESFPASDPHADWAGP